MSGYRCVVTSAFCCHLQIGSLLPGGQSALISTIKQDGHWQWLQKLLMLSKFMSPTPVLLAALFSQHKIIVVREESLAVSVRSLLNKWKKEKKRSPRGFLFVCFWCFVVFFFCCFFSGISNIVPLLLCPHYTCSPTHLALGKSNALGT